MIGDFLQPGHLLVVLAVALVVLGPKRLPEVGRALGKGIRDFRGAMAGIEQEASGMMESVATPLQPQPSIVSPVIAPTVSAEAAAAIEPIPLEHRAAAEAQAAKAVVDTHSSSSAAPVFDAPHTPSH